MRRRETRAVSLRVVEEKSRGIGIPRVGGSAIPRQGRGAGLPVSTHQARGVTRRAVGTTRHVGGGKFRGRTSVFLKRLLIPLEKNHGQRIAADSNAVAASWSG